MATGGRSWLRIVGLLGALIMAVTVLAGPSGTSTNAATSTVVREPYVVQNRRTQAKIAWKTTTSSSSIVRYGLTTAVNLTATGTSGTHHTVTLYGLTPDTRYYYRVQSSDPVLASTRPFRTLDPVADPDFRFAVVGDFGSGTVNEQPVADRIRDSHPRLLLTVGDNAYPSGSEADLDAHVFPQYEDVIDNVGINAVLGNHDVVSGGFGPERTAFAITPSGYYSFDTSSAHFTVLDSNNDCFVAGCPEYEWLVDDLAATTRPFKFVFFHHTISSCGLHGTDADLRAAWHPVFAAAGVNVAFMGHDHGYQRSKPVDGVLYVTTGGGGAGLYKWTTPCPEAVVVADSTYSGGAWHAVIVDLSAGAARIRAIRGTDGLVIDDVTVAP